MTSIHKHRERMSNVDTAWLRMDRPSNLMMICGVLVFQERLEATRLEAIMNDRFLKFERFRQRPIQSARGSYWKTDTAFDLAAHLVHATLPRPAAKAELQELVSGLMATPLDSKRPMWQFHLVDNYLGGSALIARIHHCYADGIALVGVMLSLTDRDRETLPDAPDAHREQAAGTSDETSDNSDASEGDLVGDILQRLFRFGSAVVEQGAEILREPGKAVALAEQGSAITRELARLALMSEDARTCLKGIPGVTKRVAWAEPIPLSEVKAIGKALSCSVNDVLLACVAGALRDYLIGRGEAVDGIVIRAVVPVNLRSAAKAGQLGNEFGVVFLDLPIGIANPIERLYAVRANMQALKGSYQPILVLGLLAAAGAGPKFLQQQLLNALSRNATSVMTNVPGPRQPLYLAGSRVDAMMFWVPQSGNIGMGVSILTYNGAVQFGLATDARLCPDPEVAIEGFAREFEKLVLIVLMARWEGELSSTDAEALLN